ncbi:MAG: hypothetical protein K2M97_01215, partial [Muribaculaceae bacterium]|nr:hypothetical protein [Muribaculaceae bacterium]
SPRPLSGPTPPRYSCLGLFLSHSMHRLTSALLLLAASFSGAQARDSFLNALPPCSTIAPGYSSADSVRTRMASLPLTPVEGIWQMLDGGAAVAVERYLSPDLPRDAQPGTYRMIMIKAPVRLVRPGTVIGHLKATARPGVYEARLYSDFARESGLSVPRTFYLHLATDGSTLTFKPRKSPIKFNLFSLLPYMYRRTVRIQNTRPDDLDGAIRIYPPVPSAIFGPRYL